MILSRDPRRYEQGWRPVRLRSHLFRQGVETYDWVRQYPCWKSRRMRHGWREGDFSCSG